MSGKTVNSAILLLIIGNALAIVSDIFIKLMEPGAPVFQFTFVRSALTLVLLLPLLGMVDRSRPFEGLGIHALRAHIHMIGVLCMVVALTTLPLATANAVFYVAPVIVMLLSVLLFRERLTPLSVLAVFSGFAGVVVILRPVELGWGAIAALGAAAALATSAVLVRKLPKSQSTVHKLFLNYGLMLPATLALALWEGATWTWTIAGHALGSAVFILGYNVAVLMAYKHVDAGQVTSAEYTGLVWAIAIGWIWFNEIPDIWFVVGSTMIVVPLIMIGLNQHRKRPAVQNHPLVDSKYHSPES
ncbi:DMT family transporter [uncultured Marinobacter sp.]|uniref:DMT family transporter n=1 Tax=uncultured Marinobacter sp. TaxID=187379 RepID=UPI0030DA99FD